MVNSGNCGNNLSTQWQKSLRCDPCTTRGDVCQINTNNGRIKWHKNITAATNKLDRTPGGYFVCFEQRECDNRTLDERSELVTGFIAVVHG